MVVLLQMAPLAGGMGWGAVAGAARQPAQADSNRPFVNVPSVLACGFSQVYAALTHGSRRFHQSASGQPCHPSCLRALLSGRCRRSMAQSSMLVDASVRHVRAG
jgi:hypothetical protein